MKIFHIIGISVFLLLVASPENAYSIIFEEPALPANYDHAGQITTYISRVICKEGCVDRPIILKDNQSSLLPITFNGYLRESNTIDGTATYPIAQDNPDKGTITNLANATGKSNKEISCSAKSNNTTDQVKSIQKPALRLEKSADPVTYHSAGQIITYAYTVTNSGNVVISGPIKVIDDRLGTVTISASSLLPGQSITGTATHTVSQDDLDAGCIANEAYATGTYCGKKVKSNKDTETVTSIKVPPTAQVPEFPSIALPVASILGLFFVSQYRRKGR